MAFLLTSGVLRFIQRYHTDLLSLVGHGAPSKDVTATVTGFALLIAVGTFVSTGILTPVLVAIFRLMLPWISFHLVDLLIDIPRHKRSFRRRDFCLPRRFAILLSRHGLPDMKNEWIALIPLILATPACDGLASGKTDATAQFAATSVGRVDSATEARQLVAAVDGVIADVAVKRGQQVVAGQPLLTVDCRARERSAVAEGHRAVEVAANSSLVRRGPRGEERLRAEANVASGLRCFEERYSSCDDCPYVCFRSRCC